MMHSRTAAPARLLSLIVVALLAGGCSRLPQRRRPLWKAERSASLQTARS